MTNKEAFPGGPEFSIVIPSRDRPVQLQRSLEAISRLENPREQFEVIVVDDGSREPYEPLIAPFSGAMNLTCSRCGGNGPAQARNAGVRVARGRFVALIDDDCTPAPDWLNLLAHALRSHPEALVAGRTLNALPENPFTEASQVLLSYLYAYGTARNHEFLFFASCNLAMSAELYRHCGGFDRRFTLPGGEDRDFCDRWRASGRPLVYVESAVVYHWHHLTFTRFLRQHFTYGRGAWHFHRARMDRGLDKLRVAPLPFLAGMLARPFQEPAVDRPMAISSLIATSVVANALGYFHERFHRRNHTAGR